MAKQIDFSRYEHFVDAVTSDASKDFLSLSDRLVELDQKGANIERLMTAAVGISAEGGEFTEIVKKMVFQGKPFNEDNREHLIIELGNHFRNLFMNCAAWVCARNPTTKGAHNFSWWLGCAREFA